LPDVPELEPLEEPVLDPPDDPVLDPPEDPVLDPPDDPVLDPPDDPVLDPLEDPVLDPEPEAVDPSDDPTPLDPDPPDPLDDASAKDPASGSRRRSSIPKRLAHAATASAPPPNTSVAIKTTVRCRAIRIASLRAVVLAGHVFRLVPFSGSSRTVTVVARLSQAANALRYETEVSWRRPLRFATSLASVSGSTGFATWL
jgi:hypothetical protein